MVEIHLSGKLRRYIKGTMGIQDNILTLTPEPDETIASLQTRVGIPAEEVYNIFVNHKYSTVQSFVPSCG